MLGMQGQLGMASRFQVIEFALRSFLQSHRRLMEMGGIHRIHIEAAVKVRFSVAIDVDQFRDLITAHHQDLFSVSLRSGQQAQRLTEPGSDSLPFEFLQSFIKVLTELLPLD